MNIRHPELNLRLALASALATDLEGVDDTLSQPEGEGTSAPRSTWPPARR
jgi:hypothetical protein